MKTAATRCLWIKGVTHDVGSISKALKLTKINQNPKIRSKYWLQARKSAPEWHRDAENKEASAHYSILEELFQSRRKRTPPSSNVRTVGGPSPSLPSSTEDIWGRSIESSFQFPVCWSPAGSRPQDTLLSPPASSLMPEVKGDVRQRPTREAAAQLWR